jgi:hypothetical protein
VCAKFSRYLGNNNSRKKRILGNLAEVSSTEVPMWVPFPLNDEVLGRMPEAAAGRARHYANTAGEVAAGEVLRWAQDLSGGDAGAVGAAIKQWWAALSPGAREEILARATHGAANFIDDLWSFRGVGLSPRGPALQYLREKRAALESAHAVLRLLEKGGLMTRLLREADNLVDLTGHGEE